MDGGSLSYKEPVVAKPLSCRVSNAVKDAFGSYAKGLGLADSELFRLLIKRERRHQQLAVFVRAGGIVKPSVPRKPEPAKITAHFSSDAEAMEFSEYANKCGLTRDRAGGWILEHELQERWLEQAISRSPAMP
jgi:hypothetical protein